MTTQSRAELENELLQAQVEKTRLEASALRKSPFEKAATALIDSIKVIGALLVGAVGLVTGIQGFERAKQAEIDAEKAIAKKQEALLEVERKLTVRSAELSEKELALATTSGQLEAAASQLEKIKTEAASLPQTAATVKIQSSLESLDGSIGRAYINSGAGIGASATISVSEPLDTLIEGLFAPTAALRGISYQKLMSAHAQNPQMITSLLAYASNNRTNSNGVFNALVVLSHVDYSKLKGVNIEAIKKFAESVRSNGEKTSARVDTLLSRLPK